MPTVNDIFANMPERYAASSAELDAVVQFDLTGDDGGSWTVTVSGDTLSVAEGAAEDPKATIIMDAGDFVAMSTGELNAMAAFMGGKIKVDGDLNTVMQLQPALGL